MRTALVIAHDTGRGHELALRMRERGFRPALARDEAGGVAEARIRRPDVVLIDAPDHEPSGASTARAIHGVAPAARLFVVAYDPREPRRLRAVPITTPPPRRPAPPPPARLHRVDDGRALVGGLEIDHGRGVALLAGRDVGLTPLEFRLLAALAANYGEVVEREQISIAVWEQPLPRGSRSVDVLVRRLRRKVDEVGGDFTFIQTVTGEGYRMLALPRALSA